MINDDLLCISVWEGMGHIMVTPVLRTPQQLLRGGWSINTKIQK